MASRGVYQPKGGGRDLYMAPYVHVPAKVYGYRAPQSTDLRKLVSRTAPLPLSRPSGTGRDLFHWQPYQLSRSTRASMVKSSDQIKHGIFSRKLPEKIPEKQRDLVVDARKQREAVDRLSRSRRPKTAPLCRPSPYRISTAAVNRRGRRASRPNPGLHAHRPWSRQRAGTLATRPRKADGRVIPKGCYLSNHFLSKYAITQSMGWR